MLENFFICSQIDDCLQWLQSDRYMAVAASRNHALNYPPIPPPKMFCFDDSNDIRTQFISMFIHKDFAFGKRIIEVVNRAFEGGLLIKWTKDIQLHRTDPDVLTPMPLGIHQLGGAIFGFIVTLIISILAFIAERLAHTRVRKLHPSRFWIIIDMIINDNCYISPLFEQ